MAVMQMQKFSICALKKDRNAILKTLQAMGTVEIARLAEEDDVFAVQDGSSERSIYEKAAQQSDQAIEILNKFVPEKSGLFAGKDLIERSYYDRIKDEQDKLHETATNIVSWNKRIAEDHAERIKLDTQIEALSPWMGLDVPLNTEGTRTTSLIIGAIPGEVTLEGVYSIIAEGAPEADVDVNIVSSDRDQTCITVLCLKKVEREVEDALRAGTFSRVSLISQLTPEGQAEAYRTQQQKLEEDALAMEERIRETADVRQDLKVLSDYYTMRADRYDALGDILQSKSSVIIEGYVPDEYCGMVRDTLENKYDILFESGEVPEEEDMPILLKHNAFSDNFVGVVADYALPKRHEIDPTTIMSFFYVFLFGMMLSDAAYGAIMAIACFVVLKKAPRMKQSLRRMMKLFMYCGISTLIWGILFGGYFGDLVQTIARVWGGNPDAASWNLAVWFQPLDDPMRLLIFCMIVGIVHLYTGLLLKGVTLVKQKDIAGLFGDVIFWYAFLTGLILLLVPSSIFAGIAGTQIIFPDWANELAKWMTIAGLVGLLLFGDRSSKNPLLRIGLGAYSVYGVTSWLSDVLSYSRLLALGLATGVIAQVFNQIGSMFGGGVFGTIIFIVIFLIGTVLNMAINILGAYVHTNRLQYVEFFNKFYEGGGRPFAAFNAETKYVDIKEE